MSILLLSVTDNLDPDLRESLRLEIAMRGNTVAYISSEPQEGDRPYYLSTIEDYSKISEGVKVDYFDLSENFSDENLLKLLNYGTIYLSGGNTYVFMDSANKRNISQILNKHLESGGLLIGASAGSIMMTPTIDLAGFEDENIPNLKDTSGFGFVDFEFHPHYSNDRDYLSEYINGENNDLYVCKDGSGIFYSNGEIKLFGEVSKF
ncbi:MAG: Peptidase S51, dipeptidase E [Parcubacteria group bacterium GW2011_GWA1_44_13]|uniref:Peptidase S51, dipeptidase E n=1 Tax=Candidatus Nomurabacteria bacterium GW2011_GWB1_44_12 TaxID=1618748 RepID=A0A837IB41_9BACT|nr:MAG: Peptidase S51, dipeptidase E [Candidatus Nomurabacteria bacterium GW2011_GWD1_44_10]KKT37243.1 MAG: Peptidase S51, dipeptidase E [Candidatus Nomurabacteria bacterium GW2011_GWB1_44_12]KKT38554.1 MAG: Peptidase S51, dipeptidase E [Parcubacteria group bacterium GW2011_GWA1_44_13]KKT60954.1 MAG: Peptidase S51, dipeptidase E [Parcubacteria group bacterium GW2011_GWC1_44_26]